MEARERAGKREVLLYGVVLYVASLFLTGCGIYWSNQGLQLPLVFQWNDSSLYPSDPFVATLGKYASLVWPGVAWLNRYASIESLLVGLFLLERLFVIFAAAMLADAIAPKTVAAAVGAMAFFAAAPRPILGGGTIVTDNFEHTGLSIALILMSIAFFYRKRPLAAFLWLGLAFQANCLYGVYASSYFAAVFLSVSDYRKEWKRWLPGFILLLVLLIPVAIMVLPSFRHEALDTALWLRAARLRLPHHLFPLTWSPAGYAAMICVVFATVVILRSSYVRKRWMRLSGFCLVFTLVCLGWFALAFLAAYIFSYPLLLVLHPARGTDIWYCLAGPALLAILAERFRSSRRILGPLLTAVIVIWAAACFFLRGGFILRPDADQQAVAHWARANTRIDSVFIVNPLWDAFRSLSRRSAFVTWKDGSAILWDRPFVRAWSSRLNALGFDIWQADAEAAERTLEDRYATLSDEQAAAIAYSFGAQYWVTGTEHKSQFQEVFRTTSVKVLKVSGKDKQ